MDKSGEEKTQVAASILSVDFSRLGEQVEEALEAGIRWTFCPTEVRLDFLTRGGASPRVSLFQGVLPLDLSGADGYTFIMSYPGARRAGTTTEPILRIIAM
jgi:hypothetical protein